MSQSPSQIRELISEKWQVLEPHQISSLSKLVCERFLSSLRSVEKSRGELRGLNVCLYRSIENELDLSLLETPLTQLGVRLYFPRMKNRAKGLIEMVEIKQGSPPESWKQGFFGIMEPAPALKACEPSKLDLVLVPGVAFGRGGERIGRGLGFYDRFLATVPQALRVALTLDLQIFPNLPQETWDQRMDWIISETCEIKVPRAKRGRTGLRESS